MLPLWQYNDGGIWKRTFDLDEVNVRYTFEVDPDGQITMEEQISSLIFDHPKNTFHEETCSPLPRPRACQARATWIAFSVCVPRWASPAAHNGPMSGLWTNVRSLIPFLSVDRPFRALDFQKKLRLIQVIYQEAEPGSHLVS